MKLCVSTVVDENYQAYIPMFIFCLKKAYPEYDVKIFLHGKLDKKVKEALNYVDGYQIVPKLFDGWHKSKYSPISWRFIIPPEQYADYDYIYVGDIDMMILREKISLLDYHLNEMNETGFCYSNSLRTKRHWKGRESFTGLHFFNQDWLTRTEHERAKYADLLKRGRVGEKREFDGHMLYLMAKHSNLPLVGKKKNIKNRHHGVHLGNFRLYSDMRSLKKRMDPDKCRKWFPIRQDPVFIEILNCVSECKMVREQIYQFDEYCKAVL